MEPKETNDMSKKKKIGRPSKEIKLDAKIQSSLPTKLLDTLNDVLRKRGNVRTTGGFIRQAVIKLMVDEKMIKEDEIKELF